MTDTKRFEKLFRGRSNTVGLGPKVKTETREPSTDDFRKHLDSDADFYIGVSPLREDLTCYWGAVDLDGEQDHAFLAKLVAAQNAPLIVARSRSGKGAHLYLFLKEPVAAPEVVRSLNAWVAKLGVTSKEKKTGEPKPAEIFPKQTHIPQDRNASWIFLPYGPPPACAIGNDGSELTLTQFLNLADERRVSAAGLRASTKDVTKPANPDEPSGDYDQGGRNSWLFRHGLRWAEQHPEDWEDTVAGELNEHNPHGDDLPEDEIEQVIESIKRHIDQHGVSQPYDKSDEGNARRLMDMFGERMRFVPPWDTWLVWDGKRWEVDKLGQAYRLAVKAADQIQKEAYKLSSEKARKKWQSWGVSCQNVSKVRSCLTAASSMNPVVPDDLDVNPLLLNVNNGTLRLQRDSVELVDHMRDELITKLIDVPYNPEAECPRWLRFLDEVCLGDGDLVSYLHRLAGYSLTGLTTERAIFILHGSGANGKSTFLETLRHVWGDYGDSTGFETFMTSANDKIRNDIARLHGTRLVTATEAAENKRLDEALVKRLTGGDTVVARFLFQELFEYVPTFKIVLGTNHKPEIRGTDKAIWDRIHLIPFHLRLEEDERDQELGETLKSEAEGILAWAVEGYLQWRERGLDAPKVVLEETEQYKKERDLIGRFLEDACLVEQGNDKLVTTTQDLYRRYVDWCDARKQWAVKDHQFVEKMKDKGFEKTRKQVDGERNTVWLGIKVQYHTYKDELR